MAQNIKSAALPEFLRKRIEESEERQKKLPSSGKEKRVLEGLAEKIFEGSDPKVKVFYSSDVLMGQVKANGHNYVFTYDNARHRWVLEGAFEKSHTMGEDGSPALGEWVTFHKEAQISPRLNRALESQGYEAIAKSQLKQLAKKLYNRGEEYTMHVEWKGNTLAGYIFTDTHEDQYEYNPPRKRWVHVYSDTNYN